MNKDIGTNKRLILEHERTFAASLANGILDKPRLSTWMILIPVIFVFYFQDLAKYKKQRAAFIDNYLLTRKKALNEAEQAMDERRKPDTAAIAARAGLKDKAAKQYDVLLQGLADHYTLLLGQTADSFQGLVAGAYGNNRGRYLLFLNQLNQMEQQLNKALKPGLRKTRDGVGTTIKKIEITSDKLRRAELDLLFS